MPGGILRRGQACLVGSMPDLFVTVGQQHRLARPGRRLVSGGAWARSPKPNDDCSDDRRDDRKPCKSEPQATAIGRPFARMICVLLSDQILHEPTVAQWRRAWR